MAKVEAASLEEVQETILKRIRKLNGLHSTLTLVVAEDSMYSRNEQIMYASKNG